MGFSVIRLKLICLGAWWIFHLSLQVFPPLFLLVLINYQGARPPVGRLSHSFPFPESAYLYDKCSLAKFQIAGLTVKDQKFVEITSFPKDSQTVPYDGTFGLGWPRVGVEGVETVFNNMIKQQLVTKPVFSFYFNR